MAEMESLRLERRKKGLNEEEVPGGGVWRVFCDVDVFFGKGRNIWLT